MDESALRQKILALAAPIVHSLCLEIWGLEIVSGPRMIVRLFIDAPSEKTGENELSRNDLQSDAQIGTDGDTDTGAYAGIDECEQISRRLELALDVEDSIAQAWTLEVSTPGFGRRFFEASQLVPYIGDIAEARLFAPLADYPGNPSVVRGVIDSVENDVFTLLPCAISGDGEIIPENLPPAAIRFESARRVCRIPVFRKPQKPGGKKGSRGAK